MKKKIPMALVLLLFPVGMGTHRRLSQDSIDPGGGTFGVVSSQSQAQSSSGPLATKTRVVLLARKAKLFAEYAQDFSDFNKSYHYPDDTIEREISLDLGVVATETYNYLDSARALLEVYDTVSCGPDRTRILPIIKDELSGYSKQINLSVGAVNMEISLTKIPVVATTGIRLREDLRDASAALDTLELP